jgi:glycine cleavage system H lipoate-binding protein
MVMVLVVLSFVVFIALDYFVFSRRPAEASAPESLRAAAREPLPTVRQGMPSGVYLQPTFTWSRLGPAGEVYLGVHPMLVALVGEPCEYELRGEGETVRAGEPLLRLGLGRRHLTVRSPIAGRVEHVNRIPTGETRWRDLEANNGGWLYRIRPAVAVEGDSTWMVGERAAEWTGRQYGRLREFLQAARADGHLGVVMADGGELPVGILQDLDESVWEGLEDRFLTPVA